MIGLVPPLSTLLVLAAAGATRSRTPARQPTGTRDVPGAVRIGCSGWNYDHWRGIVYPKRGSSERWLELYSRWFDTVEVNATFYRLPPSGTARRWAESTPPDFCFAVKASRYLTHVRRLRELPAGMARLGERIEPLREAGKLGPILWQLPPRFPRNDERLAEALASLPPGRHAFEFRDPTWLSEDVYAILRDHGAALVVADRAPRRPTPRVQTADWSYVRFHEGRARDGGYGPDALRRWADRIDSWEGDVYAYFNNDWQGFAVANARRLRRMIGGG